MKKRIIQFIILFLFTVQLLAQGIKQTDSIYINDKTVYFTHLSFGKYSKAKSVKIFTCLKKDLNTFEKKIRKCYKKHKVNFTEFYLIPIGTDDTDNGKIIKSVINKIDKIRMSNNLSTIQIPFKELYDSNTKNIKIIYDKDILIEINEIKNLHQIISIKQVCNLMIE